MNTETNEQLSHYIEEVCDDTIICVNLAILCILFY